MADPNAVQQLQWQVAMGADEAVEETPRAKRPKKAAIITEAVTVNTAVAPVAPKASPVAAAPLTNPNLLAAETQKLADACTTLAELRQTVLDFKGLSICRTATNPVFADGNPESGVVFVGEAPGADEDEKGIPFCGASGQLLDNALAHIGLKRAENFYITNTVFWRPPGNRKPTPEELAVCRPFVAKHMALVKPKFIVMVGATAASALMDNTTPISKIRGNWLEYTCPLTGTKTPAMPVFHPSFLLRQPMQKKTFWQDLLTLKLKLIETGLL